MEAEWTKQTTQVRPSIIAKRYLYGFQETMMNTIP